MIKKVVQRIEYSVFVYILRYTLFPIYLRSHKTFICLVPLRHIVKSLFSFIVFVLTLSREHV